MRYKKGTVVSNKMDKTVVVAVDSYKIHPIYKKRFKVTKKFAAHDPENKLQEGETVTIYESTPISKTKKWTTIKPATK